MVVACHARIQEAICQPGTLVHTVHCELYLHVTLSHMIPLLVEYINALHSCLSTTTFFSLSHLPFARPSHIRQRYPNTTKTVYERRMRKYSVPSVLIGKHARPLKTTK
jgi:hypothetical protein